jgi:osmoprotectant transport system permease protein
VSGPVLAGGGPVIPSFGKADKCITHHHWFCRSWVEKHWSDILQPALIQHIELTLIAVGIGFGIAFVMALVGFRFRVLDAPLGAFGDFLYALPSLSLFVILVPITGLSWTTIEIPLVAYTLFILYRNTISGLKAVPADVLESAQGMGLTGKQTFFRVRLRLAVPAIIAGLRIAMVSTISIATIAAFLVADGLGKPIFDALEAPDIFKTELVAASALVVGLALVADGLLFLAQRALTPWERAR